MGHPGWKAAGLCQAARQQGRAWETERQGPSLPCRSPRRSTHPVGTLIEAGRATHPNKSFRKSRSSLRTSCEGGSPPSRASAATLWLRVRVSGAFRGDY